MSKGYAVHALMKQPREAAINEELIRDCIFLPAAATTDEERMQLVGNRNEALFKEKTAKAAREKDLGDVNTLVFSYRHIGEIANLYGLRNLTKLCLDNNHITKIANLDHLTKLQVLDLSYNRITVIEGLDALVELDSLSLYANSISTVGGLEKLTKLTTLSLGKNALEALDETVVYLHNLKSLRVLTLKECKLAAVPQYKSKVLAFVATLRFLDGCAIRQSELAQAREQQHENLLSVDEQDELSAAQEKTLAEQASTSKEYQRLNCPNEATLYDELLQLQPDGPKVMDVLRSEALIGFTKEILDRCQSDFNEKAKELTDAMKAVRARRDADEASYLSAVKRSRDENVAASRLLMKNFEKRLKTALKGDSYSTGERPADAGGALRDIQADLQQLQSDLVEKEADLYEVNESLNNATLAKWRTDGVDVLLQGQYEVFFKLESDCQVALRHAFDKSQEQRQKKERAADDDFGFATDRDGNIAAVLTSKDDYQKLLADWFELRRKRLEELEMSQLRAEERLLSDRTASITNKEKDRHRNRLAEIIEYVEQISDRMEVAA